MSENVLELKNITMKFGGVTALNDVNLVVKKGEILALIGPNGAGKTTIFNVVTGVYKPTSGDVVFSPIREGGALYPRGGKADRAAAICGFKEYFEPLRGRCFSTMVDG